MPRLRFTTAKEVFEAFPAAKALVRTPATSEPPLTFLAGLLAGKAGKDAIGFCAFLLPRRETVWWALQCVLALQPDGLRRDPGLRAADAWVRDPNDPNRRAALSAAEAGDGEEPGTFIAWAAGYSGGSMIESHAVPCPPDLTAKMARIAVLAALARLPERERDAALRASVERCMRLANETVDRNPS